jgi:hypothetical protein
MLYLRLSLAFVARPFEQLKRYIGTPAKVAESRRKRGSIAITGDIYGHTSDATTRAAIDGLSGILGL